MTQKEPQTLTIDNLGGPLTRKDSGDINSGMTKFETSWGYDPYSRPGNLTWLEQPTSILTLTGAAGPIMAMKQRAESGINYVYAIANNRNLYRIQVSNASSPNLDSPSVLGAVVDLAGAAQFDDGGYMEFYGATEKIFIGGRAIQKINFDGSSPASVASTESSGTPKPLARFLGKLYFGNGANIGEIDSTELLVTGSKLSPALPSGLFVRDLDVTPDGNYLQITASRGTLEVNPLGEAQPGVPIAESYKFYWNGTDAGATSSNYFPGTKLTASEVSGGKDHAFGYDSQGLGVLLGRDKILTIPNSLPPFSEATFTTSNMLGFATVEYVQADNRYRGVVYNHGQYDPEIPSGLFRLLRFGAVTANSDIVSVPACENVSNLVYAHPFRAATGSIANAAKIYVTATEASALGTPVGPHRVLKFPTVPVGTGSIVAGTYETQTQQFSKKAKISEVRVYTEPLIGGNDFIVDLIGSGGSVMAGGSQRFQVATGSIVTGTDMVQFNPGMATTYALGVRITNSSVTGVANWTANKIEVDYAEGGR